MMTTYKNEWRQVNKNSYGLKRGEYSKKQRRQDRDGVCRELKDGGGE